ncbi:MAG: SDR family oxidoreductase [Bacteroidales bacterium]|nr:SDR family oxidoreductase [Candidatus Equibacterium intestinale]
MFTGKTIVITGATSGIGLACARNFAVKGARLVLAARSLDKLAEVEKELSAVTEVLAVKADVSCEDDCRNLIEKAVERFGGIDVLVNNAGISMRALFKDLDLKVIRSLMDTNFWGTVYCTKYALPYLLEAKGSVVGVISTAGFVGLPGRTGYSSSKFAVRGFLNTLRIEHIKDGLHVMVFAPGFTASNIRHTALTADGSQQGRTPRDEGKMMTAEAVALKMEKGIMRRKAQMVLTPIGKLTYWLGNRFPRLTDRLEYSYMAKEPDSPFK